jgi:hypothetical protein
VEVRRSYMHDASRRQLELRCMRESTIVDRRYANNLVGKLSKSRKVEDGREGGRVRKMEKEEYSYTH